MTRGKLTTLLVTCRQLEAWLVIDQNFRGWPAAQSYLQQLQRDIEPFLCPTCKDLLPEKGPCPCSNFGEMGEEDAELFSEPVDFGYLFMDSEL